MTDMTAGYARALFDLAQEEKKSDEFLHQLQVLDTAFSAEPDFLRLLANPGISKAERCQMLDESFRDGVHLYVLNFMKLLTENGDILTFHDCVKQFRSCYNEANGILCVLAISAVALSEQQREKLQQKLETITGKKVQLETKIDPACLGGLRLDYNGKRIDGTVRNRLDAMAKQLSRATL
jgi:F-type H+-transporting ATPase subunit delta